MLSEYWRCGVPVIIPDEALRQAGLSDQEALVEIACRLFNAEKLHLWPAAKLAGLSRGEFESELASRGMGRAPHRPDLSESRVGDEHKALENRRE